MEMLLRRAEGKRVDRERLLLDADGEIATAKEPGEALVPTTEVEDHGERLVLLCVGQQEVQKERLPASGGPEEKRMRHVLVVKVQVVRRPVLGLEDGQVLAIQVRVAYRAGFRREDEREIRVVGVDKVRAAKVVGSVAGHSRQKGVEKVVPLVYDDCVVRRKRLEARSHAVVQPRPV